MESVLSRRKVLSPVVCSKPQGVAGPDFAHLVNQEATRDAPASGSGGATETMSTEKSRRLLLRLWFSAVVVSVSLLFLTNVLMVAAALWSLDSTSSNGLLSDTDSGENKSTYFSLEEASMGKFFTRAGLEQPTSSPLVGSDFIEAPDAAERDSSAQGNNNKPMLEGRTDVNSKARGAAGRPTVTMGLRARAMWLGNIRKEAENPTSGPHTDFPLSPSSRPSAISASAGVTRSKAAWTRVAHEGGGPVQAVGVLNDVAKDQFRTAAGAAQSHSSSEGSDSTVPLNAKPLQKNSPRAALGRGLPRMHLSSRLQKRRQNVFAVAKRSNSFPRYGKDFEEYSCSSTCSSTSSSSTASAGVSKLTLRNIASKVRRSGSATARPRKGESSYTEGLVATGSMEPVEGAAPRRELVGTQTQQTTTAAHKMPKKSPEDAQSKSKLLASRRSTDVRDKDQSTSEHTAVQDGSPSTKFSNLGTRVPYLYPEDHERGDTQHALQYSKVHERIALPRSNAAASVASHAIPKLLRTSSKEAKPFSERRHESGNGDTSSKGRAPATQGATSLGTVHRGTSARAPWEFKPQEQATSKASPQERPENIPSDGRYEDRVPQQPRRQEARVLHGNEWMTLRFHLKALHEEAGKVVHRNTGVTAGQAAAQSIPPMFSPQHQQQQVVRPKVSASPFSRSRQSGKDHKCATQSGTPPPKSSGNTVHLRNKKLLRSFAMGQKRLKEEFSDFFSRVPGGGVPFSIPCFCGSVHSSRFDSSMPASQAGCHAGPEDCQNNSTQGETQQKGVQAEAEKAGEDDLEKTGNASERSSFRASTLSKTTYSSENSSRRGSTTSGSSQPSEPAVSVWGPRPRPFLFDVVSFKNRHNYESRTETEKSLVDHLIQQLLRVELWLASLPDDVTIKEPWDPDTQ